MGKKLEYDLQTNQKEAERVEAVLHLLKKQSPPLTLKQEKFCNNACVKRFLKCKGESVKRAAKQLRACLSWRESVGMDHLMADEFSGEIADGVAYVSGHDEEARPVIIFRIKQNYQKLHSQKQYVLVHQFSLQEKLYPFASVYDGSRDTKHGEKRRSICPPIRCNCGEKNGWNNAGFFRSASAFMNVLLGTLKMVGEFYPCRLHKAFVIDPPSVFSYLWKGVKPFVELSPITMVVSSLDFEESLEFSDFASYPRASSLRFNPSAVPSTTAKIGSCSSSRFSFTVSHNLDSLKPWHLSLTDTSASKVGPTTPALVGPALISPLNARSYSFASPVARTSRGNAYPVKKSYFPSTPLPQKTQVMDHARINHPRTPKPSFLQSPALFFRKECHVSRADKCRESFVPFLKFYRRPYDEMTYRSKMRPPLGGLISIISPQLRRRHMSISQRF
ncbi:hypothetical protein RJ640_011391 [Escallonia rubra]|uniref:CRAL-TRIO domain-containing protein n=1 Tax=Escallonia rubra TaxID=112253 RepID=A0AA88U9S9_9ASTE|nr:hypothetical protein RJ640_011391 [Escallonia rubra]